PPFFDEVLGQLQAHHQLADLGASQRELALLGITPGFEPSRALLEEDALPALELVGWHLALSRYRVERFTPEVVAPTQTSAGRSSVPGARLHSVDWTAPAVSPTSWASSPCPASLVTVILANSVSQETGSDLALPKERLSSFVDARPA